ncbi:hypothetical protein SAMN04488589_1532 [Methanolobus vulcani]|uniref:Uncharacterized protein n=1 Tax=Methanolobus vulcani TaxID=38026 RepID=A0A7Z7AZH2_9EURY|nr:hypothetical protein [Methanolobus vulcani]SDF85381.1 hypothetical protein SAMN04488589_1532 [Methanolobus vulcani]
MGILDNAKEEIFWIAISVVITFIVTAIGTYLYQKHVIIFLRSLKIKHFYRSFRYSLLLKAYYPQKTGDLDSNIYNLIKEKCKQFNITKVTVRPESMCINPENFGTKVNIFIDSIDELLGEEEITESEEYCLTIQLDSDLRLTYKELEIIDDYLVLMEETKNIVHEHCFGNSEEKNSFLVCEIIRDIKKITDEDTINIEKEETKVSFKENNVKITLKKPQYLTRNIRKYIGY